MVQSIVIPVIYLSAAVFFIVGMKNLSHPRTAPWGNTIAAAGMLLAIIATLIKVEIIDYRYIALCIAVGSVFGAVAARSVQMTSIPQLVALFNGFGGGASMLVATAEFYKQSHLTSFTYSIIVISILVGSVTLTGSFVAFAKLQGIMRGAPVRFKGQHLLNGFIGIAILTGGGMAAIDYLNTTNAILFVLGLALVLGYTFIIPIGGADMPVVISLLNSFSGLAASLTGFVIHNKALIICGTLVGASGIILTNIMCKGMNRTIWDVLFGGMGSDEGTSEGGHAAGKAVKSYEPEDTVVIFENAKLVIIIPGYGMAVAQAQHMVHELQKILESKGATVKYAVHPVAGRMPGHMNVLLAETNISYDKLYDLDQINPEFEEADIALVIGANDVVNPEARHDKASPLYGMPILDADKAQTVFVLKRSMNTGFAGVENELFFYDNTIMLFGDAKDTVSKLVSELK
tara:strand:- start:2575 stop:3951 length:1377 start_codon:yes stop_codon:yes gene_type:complete